MYLRMHLSQIRYPGTITNQPEIDNDSHAQPNQHCSFNTGHPFSSYCLIRPGITSSSAFLLRFAKWYSRSLRYIGQNTTTFEGGKTSNRHRKCPPWLWPSVRIWRRTQRNQHIGMLSSSIKTATLTYAPGPSTLYERFP